MLNSLLVSSVLTPTSPFPFYFPFSFPDLFISALISLIRPYFVSSSKVNLLVSSFTSNILKTPPGLLLLSPTRPAAPKSSRGCPRLRLWLFFAGKSSVYVIPPPVYLFFVLPGQVYQLLVAALDNLLDQGHPLVQPVDDRHLGDQLRQESGDHDNEAGPGEGTSAV